MRWTPRSFLPLLSVALAAVLAPAELGATPQFARTYRVDCSHCHASPPRLNERGLQFLAAGYWLDGREPASDVRV